jgi:hypothetical protein
MIKRSLLIAALLMMTACAPARLQTAEPMGYDNGLAKYKLTGYTDLGDTAPNAALKYIEYSVSETCPDGFTVLKLDEYDAKNGFGKFLYWQAEIRCK